MFIVQTCIVKNDVKGLVTTISVDSYLMQVVGLNALRQDGKTIQYPTVREALKCLAETNSLDPICRTTWMAKGKNKGWVEQRYWILEM